MKILTGAVWSALLSCLVHAGESQSIRAGVSRADLTPPLAMKAALGGYGERLSRPAVGVHDAVWAKALALERGQDRFVLVTADVLAFPPKFKPAVIERLAAEGWKAEQILLLPSHSHTSLDMMALHPDNQFNIPQVGVFHRELFERTADLLARLVREAARNPVPILAATKVHAVPDRNRNRRAGNLDRDIDLTVTRIDTSDGRPLAVLVNWTAHPTFLGAGDMLFSGGWPGHLQRTLEALIGENVTALYYNGAEGDQSPTPHAGTASGWERAERYGCEMAILTWRVFQGIAPKAVSEFAFVTEAIPLPARSWHPDFLKTGGAEYGLNETMMRGFVDRLLPTSTHSTALRLGDLVIVGVPGELAAGLGLELKRRVRPASGEVTVTIGGLADEWISYILSEDEYRRGGYEASMSYYGPGLGATLLEGATRAAARCLSTGAPPKIEAQSR